MQLLAAVLKKDLADVDALLTAGANPNCSFDSIPLLCVAAVQNAPLGIVESLVKNGADPTRTVKANVPQRDSIPALLASDAQVKTYLQECFRDALSYGSAAQKLLFKPLETYTLHQFDVAVKSISMPSGAKLRAEAAQADEPEQRERAEQLKHMDWQQWCQELEAHRDKAENTQEKPKKSSLVILMQSDRTACLLENRKDIVTPKEALNIVPVNALLYGRANRN